MARRWWIGLGTSCGPRLLPAALPSSRGRGPGEAARGTGPKGDLSQNGYGPVVVAADVVVIVVVLAITVAIAVLVLVTVLFLQADSAGAQGQGLSQRQSANRASQRLKSARDEESFVHFVGQRVGVDLRDGGRLAQPG